MLQSLALQVPRAPASPYGSGGGGCAPISCVAGYLALAVILVVVIAIIRAIIVVAARVMRKDLADNERFNDFWLYLGAIAMLCGLAWYAYRWFS